MNKTPDVIYQPEEEKSFTGQPRACDFLKSIELRDYYAGQALVGILSAPVDRDMRLNKKSVDAEDIIAETAYVIADAMLAERSKDEA